MKPRLVIRLSHRDILFENDHYIAINKRRGWPSHRTVDRERHNLLDALASFLRHRDKPGVELTSPHRLDVWTSGVIVFGKTAAAKLALARVFSERQAKKKYLALCTKSPANDYGELSHFLRPVVKSGRERMAVVRSGGKKAITKYRVVERTKDFAKLEFELVTGRKHQIRAQCAHEGFPIVGDQVYGDPNVNAKVGIDGQLLHAHSLAFRDPISNEELCIEAPLPSEFQLQEKVEQPTTARLVVFHKPYGVLCQFTATTGEQATLADYALPEHVYPAGRLDKDSEGLLVLTNDGDLAHRLAHPSGETRKTYWVQVERVPNLAALQKLRTGIDIRGYRTKPCEARVLESEPAIAPRTPAIRARKSVLTAWLEITIGEGKNRQIRRMTAAVGHPTLRLIRVAVGELTLEQLAPGEWRDVPLGQ